MKKLQKHPSRKNQRGVALVISIFALLLITGVAVSLVLMSGTESAIAGNYRSSTTAFYAAYAGLEEGRGRVAPGNPNTLVGGVAPFVPDPLPVGQVRYILNPSANEQVNPLNFASTNPYRDTEFKTEYGSDPTVGNTQPTNSISGLQVPGVPGPLFKWVRITAKTEQMAGVDVDGSGPPLDNLLPIYYNSTNQTLTPGSNDHQVLRITSLAVMPDGSRRILQYDASLVTFNLKVPSAMTFDGTGSAIFPPNSNVYTVKGADQNSCGGTPAPAEPAVGTVTPGDDTNITNEINATNRGSKYTGSGATTPDVQDINSVLQGYASQTPPLDLTTPSGLENVANLLEQNATDVLTPPTGTTAGALPNLGTATSPVIEVVDGNVSLGPVTGYGVLLVRGTLTMQGATGWRGLILVIGTGQMIVSGGGNNSIEGGLLLANTRVGGYPGPISATLGATNLDWAGGGGNGVHFDHCWIDAANKTNATYKILSFREINQ